MKKKLAVVLALSMISGICGCSKASTEQATTEAVTTQEQTEEVTQSTQEENTEEQTTTQEEAVSEVSVTYETTKDEKKLDNGSVYMYISYMKPTVTILDNEEAQKQIQSELDAIESDFYTNAQEMESEAKLYYSQSENSEDETSYSSDTQYSDMRVDQKVISLMKTSYSYQGGAHGYSYISGLNYDVKTGKTLTLDDITTDKEAFLAQVKEAIIDKCDNGEYKEAVFPDYKDYIDNILTDDLWYFDENGITFIANAYEIGPYAAGTMDFTIPYDEITGFVDDYKLEN